MTSVEVEIYAYTKLLLEFLLHLSMLHRFTQVEILRSSRFFILSIFYVHYFCVFLPICPVLYACFVYSFCAFLALWHSPDRSVRGLCEAK